MYYKEVPFSELTSDVCFYVGGLVYVVNYMVQVDGESPLMIYCHKMFDSSREYTFAVHPGNLVCIAYGGNAAENETIQ